MTDTDLPDQTARPAEDRRRGPGSEEPPMATLQRLLALRVLERLPVPVVAVTNEGTIPFTNEARATLLGYPQDALQSMTGSPSSCFRT